MKGEWCLKTFDSYPLDTLVRFEGSNFYKMPNGKVALISHGNVAFVKIYKDFPNYRHETISFRTVKIQSKANQYQGLEEDRQFQPNVRVDKRGYTLPTTLKDILAYLNDSYVGEVVVENKRGQTYVAFYKDEQIV